MANTQKTGLIVSALAALGLFGLYKFSNKSQALGRISYFLKEIKLKYQKGVFVVRIDLIIHNPTSEELKFKDFSGSLFADSQKLGDIEIPNPVLIKAKTDTPISLNTLIPAGKIATLFLNALSTMSLPSKGILKGTIRVGAMQIPVDEAFDFNTPKKTTA